MAPWNSVSGQTVARTARLYMKKKYYITFDPKTLIIWGIGLSKDGSTSDATVQSTDQGFKIKTKTIECGSEFFSCVYADGHYQDMRWAIVNGKPEFINEDTFVGDILSPKFKKRTFTIERPR